MRAVAAVLCVAVLTSVAARTDGGAPSRAKRETLRFSNVGVPTYLTHVVPGAPGTVISFPGWPGYRPYEQLICAQTSHRGRTYYQGPYQYGLEMTLTASAVDTVDGRVLLARESGVVAVDNVGNTDDFVTPGLVYAVAGRNDRTAVVEADRTSPGYYRLVRWDGHQRSESDLTPWVVYGWDPYAQVYVPATSVEALDIANDGRAVVVLRSEHSISDPENPTAPPKTHRVLRTLDIAADGTVTPVPGADPLFDGTDYYAYESGAGAAFSGDGTRWTWCSSRVPEGAYATEFYVRADRPDGISAETRLERSAPWNTAAVVAPGGAFVTVSGPASTQYPGGGTVREDDAAWTRLRLRDDGSFETTARRFAPLDRKASRTPLTAQSQPAIAVSPDGTTLVARVVPGRGNRPAGWALRILDPNGHVRLGKWMSAVVGTIRVSAAATDDRAFVVLTCGSPVASPMVQPVMTTIRRR